MCNQRKFTGSKGDVLFEHQIVDRLVSGCPITNQIVDKDIALNFAKVGDIGYSLLFKSNSSITINKGVKGQLQYMTLIIKINSDNVMINLPSDIIWASSKPPYIKSMVGSFSIVELMFDGSNTIYGKEVMNG